MTANGLATAKGALAEARFRAQSELVEPDD